MARYVRPDDDQYQIMMGLCIRELFAPDAPVRAFLELVEKLDLSAFDANYKNDHGGRHALPPARMLAIIFWHNLQGGTSMRALERDLRVRADLLFLSGGLQVDHSTLSLFVARHREQINDLFAQTVAIGLHAGVIDFETVCIDSTKIKASANRRDIGTLEEFQRRLPLVQEACERRLAEWVEAETEEKSEEEKTMLKKKYQRRARQEKKIVEAIDFLQKNPTRKRVHLTDSDADWQKERSDHFIVGYSAQIAVDSKSQMIVHTEVTAQQNDSVQTVELVEAVQKRIEELSSESVPNPQYVLDSGYASEKNLVALEKYDLYMPDNHLAREMGGKTKPEDRKPPPEPLNFSYDAGDDTFRCPEGRKLRRKREKKLEKVPYVMYQTRGCNGCIHQELCAGNRNAKEIWIQASYLPTLTHKEVYPRGNPMVSVPQGPLTQRMRQKLKTPAGRAVYARRLPVVEGVFGVMTSARNGWQFLRRELVRVKTEWIERCIAHNLAKLIGYKRVSTAGM